MAEPEAMKPTANRGAMDLDGVLSFQFHAQLIERQITALREPCPTPRVQGIQLADAPLIALTLRDKPARLATQLDHVVDEFRRHPEMPRRLSVAVAFIDKGDNTFAQFNGMWFAHD